MNHRGQTLVFFIIIIPFILGCMAFVVDMGVVTYKKVHLKETIKTVIEDSYQKKSKEEIESLLKKNEIDSNNFKIDIYEDRIRIEGYDEISSIFGAIIGIKEYKLKVDITGYMENNKVYFR